MRILLAYKDSNFDRHGPRVSQQVDAGRIGPNVLRELQLSHDAHHATIERVRVGLRAAGLVWAEADRKQDWPQGSYDYVITVGGDGTVLYSSHFVGGKTKIVGVRSSDASVGYLCAFGPDDADAIGPLLQDRRVTAEPVQRLRAEIAVAGNKEAFRTQPVLNDLLFVNSNPTLTTRYILKWGERTEFQRSSGIWISTPVGSTAGIRAAGGQRQHYGSRDFQFRVRELFRGAREGAAFMEGGIFSPEAQPLLVDNRSESALLALDGQHQSIELAYGDQFSVVRAEPLNLVISPKLGAGRDGFFDVRSM